MSNGEGLSVGTRVETSLSRAWEREETFHDALYDWMRRAPWLGISLAAHLVVFFVVSAVPWNLFERRQPPAFIASIAQPEESLPEDPPPPEPEELVEPEMEEEPVVRDVDLVDSVETEIEEDFDLAEGDPDRISDAPFEEASLNDVIGIGGGGGAKFGRRFGKEGKGRLLGAQKQKQLAAGLDWLARHQSEDGSWDTDGFMHAASAGACECQGPGDHVQDVGVTALALLAFLGDGHTTREGQYRELVSRGIAGCASSRTSSRVW